MTEVKGIKIEGIIYNLDLDSLKDKADFSIINGRRFVAKGQNSAGEDAKGNLKLNDIFKEILKNHPKVDHTELINSYRNLKNAGYENKR